LGDVAFYSAVGPVAASSTTQSLVSSEVFLSYSDDQGSSWIPAVPVTPAIAATGVKRFWPVVSVEPGGNVDVVYYESQETQATPEPADEECNISIGGGARRRGPNSSLVDTFWSRSLDGGMTFQAPIRMSTATSNWCTTVSNIRPNFGDYIGAASGGKRVPGRVGRRAQRRAGHLLRARAGGRQVSIGAFVRPFATGRRRPPPPRAVVVSPPERARGSPSAGRPRPSRSGYEKKTQGRRPRPAR